MFDVLVDSLSFFKVTYTYKTSFYEDFSPFFTRARILLFRKAPEVILNSK